MNNNIGDHKKAHVQVLVENRSILECITTIQKVLVERMF